MTYLFIKSLFEREKFVLFSLKSKNLKNPKKHFEWVFLGVYFFFFLGGFFNANPGPTPLAQPSFVLASHTCQRSYDLGQAKPSLANLSLSRPIETQPSKTQHQLNTSHQQPSPAQPSPAQPIDGHWYCVSYP
jgi:hypothetical protein